MARLRRMIYQRGAIGHIYQRAQSGFVVFYNQKDSLVYFTFFSLLAVKHKIKVLGLCLMYNHIHALVEADGHEVIAGFIQELCSKFSKAYNTRYSLKGSLFTNFGLSNKHSDKQIRTALAYLYNNPVEDRICARAEEWHWNFLAYADSDHPYSKKLVLRKAAERVRTAVAKVRMLHGHKRPLTYDLLDALLDSLSLSEKKQLSDFIVHEYSIIDFGRTISFYGSYGKMTAAFSSNTGSEYDISEPRDSFSGYDYKKMTYFVTEGNRFPNITDILRLPSDERTGYLDILVTSCGVSREHARKFLRIGQQNSRVIGDIRQCAIGDRRKQGTDGAGSADKPWGQKP